MTKENIIIGGPCAIETKQQINHITEDLVQQGLVTAIRGCAFKPRTGHPQDKPFFDGTGNQGLSWLVDVGVTNKIPIATEIMLPEHVTAITKELNKRQQSTPLILWIGSRNQNHLTQSEIAKRIKNHAPEGTKLMVKNQPWGDQSHWEGIVEHVLSTGFPEKDILLCHRGFAPHKNNNHHQFRNIPDFEMAMKVKESTGRPMLLDPSHIGGSVENVFEIVSMAKPFDFDGLLVEVHPNPPKAWTDSKQQLTTEQFEFLIKNVNQK